MIEDPAFYALAVPAVLLVGLSKGGFGGAGAILGVPIMSLAVPPVQAAAILLPILLVMDGVGLYAWRGTRDGRSLAHLLPTAVAGVAIGWALAATVSSDHVRLIVGLIGIAFALSHYAGGASAAQPRPPNPPKAWFWGTVAGFTSFVSHAGGPPYQMYMLPLRLDPKVLAGTSVIFFAVVNAVKLVPYFALGQFSGENLATSAALLPLAPLATLAGVWLIRRIRPALFYQISYALVAFVSVKLVWDGTAALLA